MRTAHCAAWWVGILCAVSAWGQGVEMAEIGGPLAGLRLPLFKTQHGEPEGYPGCLREVDDKGNTLRFINAPQGNAPELELYPGSVEHWRGYWSQYMPIRSFFDRQSQVRNFVAPNIAGASKDSIESYAAPLYWLGSHGLATPTGKSLAPVEVVRCRAGKPVLRLDLGELDRGFYAVRVIGAVETKNLRPFLLPVYVRLRVNDGINGEMTEYRQRIGYNDEFYSVAELYFHAPAKRAYRAELLVDEGSQTELLVRNISLDDALAGCRWARVKTRSVASVDDVSANYSEAYTGARPRLKNEERLARDRAIWDAFVPLNKQGNDPWYVKEARMTAGAPGKSMADIEKEFGAWEYVPLGKGASGREVQLKVFGRNADEMAVLMVNAKLNLVYTVADLAAGKPLPAPYPYGDDGSGLYYPDAKTPAEGTVICPVSLAVRERTYQYAQHLTSGGGFFLRGEANPDYARDSAVALCRFAYDFPSLDFDSQLCFRTKDPGARGRNILRRRHTYAQSYGSFTRFLEPVEAYDRLFDYIKGNEDLARSIGRFVPWVRTPDDVLELLDTHLLQTMAKRVLRYHYYGDGREPERIAELATLTANREFTEPWMQWLFTRSFFYPNPLCGIQDVAITGTDRDGRSPIGSFGYMVGEFSADKIAERIEGYIRAGGDARYDLRDFRMYPKSIAALEFDLRLRTAGIHGLRFGSSSGPDKMPAAGFIPERSLTGWRWTHDPRFAYVVKEYIERKGVSDAEWREIELAAAKLSRAPWFDNRSRVLSNMMGILETGLAHDDFRFRRAAAVRVGIGYGHNHEDTLDLQVYAHGLPMVLDSGQRRDTAYSKPVDKMSMVHNTVVVDGNNWMGASWVRALSDTEAARYLCAEAVPQFGTKLFRRQVALIDVDEGRGSRTLGPAQFNPSPSGMPKDVSTPNSYIFDVFRVSGGRQHTYCFHGTPTDLDGPQAALGVAGIAPLGPDTAKPAAEWLAPFADPRFAGRADAAMEVTFPLLRDRVVDAPRRPYGTEKYWLRDVCDPQSPLKFTRWHIFNAVGLLAMKGDQDCFHYGYRIPHAFVQRSGDNLESAFATVVEPFAGEAFITGKRALAVKDNDADARQAVALELKTRNGHTDICFADGRPENTRSVAAASPLTVAAEFAFLSSDEQGLRQATLSGGTLLSAPGVLLAPERRELSGTVTHVDYFAKTVVIDQPWPEWNGRERYLEIGVIPESRRAGRTTSYAAISSRRQGNGTCLAFTQGADCYRAQIARIDAAGATVSSKLSLPVVLTGYSQNLPATNDDATKSWRADAQRGDPDADEYPFKLTGAPVAEKDFAPSMALRLWEYGPGDSVRQNAYASLRRVADGTYEFEANVPCSVGLPWPGMSASEDGKEFRPLRTTTKDGLAVAVIGLKELGPVGRLWIRK